MRNWGQSRPWGSPALISPAGVFLFFPFSLAFSHALYRVSLRSTTMPILRTGKLSERDILKAYVLQHQKKVVHIFYFCTKVFISILVLVVKKTGRCESPIQGLTRSCSSREGHWPLNTADFPISPRPRGAPSPLVQLPLRVS